MKQPEMRPNSLAHIFSCLLLFLSVTITAQAQQADASLEKAKEHFNRGQYREALPYLESLLEIYPRGPQTNYYYGISLVKLKRDNAQAIKSLKYASLRRGNPDVYYYLGRAYQNAYEFEEAGKQFQTFLDRAKPDDPLKARAQKALEDSRGAIKLINKYFEVTVIQKDTLPADQILNLYHLSPESGTLTTNQHFFKSGVAPNQVMYQTELGNEVFFVLEQPDTALFDIHKMVKLLDKWSQSSDLGEPVNTPYDERFPFLLVDGTTFYFSSDRPGGMGGMDIYQTFYDSQTGLYTSPENLGPPFNSPADDYLFAADAFENRAWFTTNRGMEEGMAVVVQIIWDHTVIKNLARDTEQIRQLANLPLNPEKATQPPPREQSETEITETISPSDALFQFYVNDTLLYTRFEHFLSQEALNEFKTGFDIQSQKDSLERTLNHKRRVYSESYNKDELQQLIAEILQLEKEVYALAGNAEQHYLKARNLENEKIRELKGSGKYRGIENNRPSGAVGAPMSGFHPDMPLYYEGSLPARDREKLAAMYHNQFSGSQAATLLKADSLYAWANLLKLEAARLLEQGTTQSNSAENLTLFQKIKNIDSLNKPDEPERDYVREARNTRDKALKLYHEALDNKYRIYLPRLRSLSNKPGHQNFADSLSSARSYYEEATQQLDKMFAHNPERYEALGSLKRKAVHIMENSLLNYHNADAPLTQKTAGSATKSYPATHYQDEKPAATNAQEKTEVTPPPAEIVSTAFSKTPQPVYKIQIGVFSNKPDSRQFQGLQEISTLQVEGKAVVKYFIGRWNSYREANIHLPEVRENGFKDAFVVALLNDKIIPINEARRMSGER